MSEHEIIYLEPVCPKCGEAYLDRGGGRQWCQDDVWDKACGGCGGPVKTVKYVRVSDE